MRVYSITHISGATAQGPSTGATLPRLPELGKVEIPKNGNPGIVPPWLQGDKVVILPWPPINPTDPIIDPDTPHIM